jgi:hypothetical protein
VTGCALAAALLIAGSSPGALRAADARAGSAPIELPPMLVEESNSSVPWLYVSVGGTEYLSRCSRTTTRDFITAVLARTQLMRVLVPEEFLARSDVPEVIVLYAQDLKQTVSAEIQRELRAGGARGAEAPADGVDIAPNMRLTDRDMHASIVYIDESQFDGATLSLAPSHVRHLMQRRVPEPPEWLLDGIERTFRRAEFVEDPITLNPLVWQNPAESEALAGDATRPRAVMPAGDLFASPAAPGRGNNHARHRETRAATAELFVRWALTTSTRTRAALWQFAARAAEQPATEEMFAAAFGFDFAELRDRLSDYLPEAVDEAAWIDPGKLPPLPAFEVDRATPGQIARVRGEWERLAIGHVQRRLPQAREPYLAQARRTLHRAYDAGDRDPRLLATLGLCEVDAGNDAGARAFLEPAVALGVVRPRACYELARIRFAALRAGAPEEKRFAFGELAPVFQPLQQAATQAPPLAEAFALLGEAWSRCATPPNTAEFAALQAGARWFPRRPHIVYPIALALARHGRPGEAAAMLAAAEEVSSDDATRAAIAQLRRELAAPPP